MEQQTINKASFEQAILAWWKEQGEESPEMILITLRVLKQFFASGEEKPKPKGKRGARRRKREPVQDGGTSPSAPEKPDVPKVNTQPASKPEQHILKAETPAQVGA